ncbi:MAG: hypothetical protein JWN86_4347 [Planctomycetota bacterium]|nr:hypothetical protein [Planctomycetota bacterium]
MAETDPKRSLLRHTIATLAYRASRALGDAPEGFGAVRARHDTRSAEEILAHMGDLFDWAVSIARGQQVWKTQPPGAWSDDVTRLFGALETFDAFLASDAPMGFSPEAIFQGPIADALTHVGQLATLRRLAGSPVLGENYLDCHRFHYCLRVPGVRMRAGGHRREAPPCRSSITPTPAPSWPTPS